MSIPSVVRAFIFNQDWDVLLTKHKKDALWVLPWGHVESDESLHDAMKRELQEEFWIDANFFEIDSEEILYHRGKKLLHFPAPISIYELRYTNKNWEDKSRIEHIFLMETLDNIKTTQPEEISEFKWFEIDEVLSMKPNIETFDFIIEMLEKIISEDDE